MTRELFIYIKKRIWMPLLFIFAYILYKIAFIFPETTEAVYSQAIYPFFAGIYSSLASFFPISIGEICLYLFILLIAFYIVFSLSGLFVKEKQLFLFAKRIVSLLCIICITGSIFIFNWAINYARVPLAKTMGYQTETYSAQELKETTEILITRCNNLRKTVSQDENGVFKLSSSREDILTELPEIYEKNAPEYMHHVKSGANAKGVLTKDLLSTFETTGIFSPFTYEANINMHMHQLTFPVTCVHEYAHLQGYAREDEANFIAWYIARNSTDTDFAYSAYAMALMYALNSLYTASIDYYSSVYASISDDVIRDFRSYNEYWNTFDTKISEQANEIYSDYLKASGVSDGKKSYGRMLDLILAMHQNGEVL